MTIISKSDLQCQICKKILKYPVHLPCHCTICHGHLTDGSVKDGHIKCEQCGDKFVVKDIEFKVNKLAKRILNAEGHLRPEENTVKGEMQELLKQLQQLYDQLQQEQAVLEGSSYDHFAEIKRLIDLQRENLKDKFDEISLTMIKQVEHYEALYKEKLNETSYFKEFNAEKDLETFEDEIRKMELSIERVQQLQTKCEANVSYSL